MSDHAAQGGDTDLQRIARRELDLAAGQPVDAIGAAQGGEPLAPSLQAQPNNGIQGGMFVQRSQGTMRER
jgi:hypothetical protein